MHSTEGFSIRLTHKEIVLLGLIILMR